MQSTMSLKQVVGGTVASRRPARQSVVVRAGAYDEELIATAKKIASPGRCVAIGGTCMRCGSGSELHHVPTGDPVVCLCLPRAAT